MKKKKNRKRVDGFVFPVPFAGALIIVATLALAYVWMGCRCETLGRALKALESERTTLEKQFQSEQNRWAQLKSPRNLERVLAKHQVRLVWPGPSQVVKLKGSSVFDARRMVTQAGRFERVVMNE